MYISPSNSSYAVRTGIEKEIFQKLEGDVSKYSSLGEVMVMGDMNAHINSNELDFVHNELNDPIEDFLPPNYIADSVQLQRNTQIPQSTNSYGKNIIELCTSSQLRILNGRTLGDSFGKVTYHSYNGASIVDYCLCSSSFLSKILSFRVEDFHPNLSDHCPTTVNILCCKNVEQQRNCLRQLPLISGLQFERKFLLKILKN